MAGPTEDLSAPTVGDRRPRDLAVLLLAVGTGPPRERARDQQADRAGGELRRRVLDRIAAVDPESGELDELLAGLAFELGGPTGPALAVCSQFRQEWADALQTPRLWEWLIAEAIERAGRKGRRKQGGDLGAP